ncbi:hypothetical protein [Agrococcus casei]|uniref:hypothetical protein n=1 Tax=Agrococcus casei TaxID=343512 RepID=UPI000B3530E7|nr:hypothetical protein [Agrococcus casei]
MRRVLALPVVAVLALVGCAGDDPSPSPSESDTVITAPPPTLAPSPTEDETPAPEFDDVDTSDWREAAAQDGRGSLKVPPGWGWNWEYQTPAGVPAGQYLDIVHLTVDGNEMITLQDSQNPPAQCSGDGEAVLLDSAELPADSAFSYVAIALPGDDGVQFAAGVIETDRIESDTCGVSFFIQDELPYMVATTALLPDPELDGKWEFESLDAARDYLGEDEFEVIRASLLSFQPPA